ncbi:MAG: CRISPR-associated protein Cas5h [Eubacteriales bacterium]|nr:CRISPR-associated protein Cas5h [Eubacteriales bacterium]
MRVLVFDIWGDFAHFKKFYTTSSPLTFSFPPPPTVKGMLAAIIGINRHEEDYLYLLRNEVCRVGVRILHPIRKTRWGLNHINTKGGFWQPEKKGTHEARTQIRTEFIKFPAYRIYIHLAVNDLYAKLKDCLQQHRSYYTFSLGLSELLGDFRFVGEKDVEEREEMTEEKECFTVIPVSLLVEKGLVIEPDKTYFKERVPVEMIPGREVVRYEDVIFDPNGRGIKARLSKYWEADDGECIAFF